MHLKKQYHCKRNETTLINQKPKPTTMTRMLFLLLISVLSTIFFCNPIFAQNSTAKPLPIQVYEKAWGEPNSEVRLKMLKTSQS